VARRDLDNAAIANRLGRFAAVLDLAGASTYSIRAYRRAADLIRSTPVDVAGLVRTGRVRELRGIGAGIEARLRELVETGEIAELVELERTTDPELVGIGRYLGLSPKRSVEIGRALGVRTVGELRAAAAEGRLREVPGIGTTTERRLRERLARDPAESRPSLLLSRARVLVEGIAGALGGTAAGDVRRWRDQPERLAVVCASSEPTRELDAFAGLPEIVAVVERDERRALGVTVEGVPVELFLVTAESFGTALLQATGSEPYVEALGPLPEAAQEEEAYRLIGIPFCPPELREQPFAGEPPPLLELADVRGDLHCHTTRSDGRASVYEMGLAARERGYEYLAICDHTKSVRVVPGLGADDVREQAEEIGEANERLAPFRILRGIECDILRDGTLDLPDDVLGELDWVQASLHAGQRRPREEVTKQVIEAMRNPHVSALSHPTGRLIGHRPENALDLERAIEVAIETGTALEVNGLPNRLDLRDEYVRLAVEAGASIVVSTDAHSVQGLGNMELAVHTARRGWATAADAVNARSLSELLA
jgi:DNA polymerase (family X)